MFVVPEIGPSVELNVGRSQEGKQMSYLSDKEIAALGHLSEMKTEIEDLGFYSEFIT